MRGQTERNSETLILRFYWERMTSPESGKLKAILTLALEESFWLMLLFVLVFMGPSHAQLKETK